MRPGPRPVGTWPTPSTSGAADDVVPLVQHALQLGDGLGWVGRHGAGELEGRGLGRGGGGDAVDEAEPQRLIGADGAGGEQQVLGGGEAAEGDQAGGADGDPQCRTGEAHPQVGAADAHVAGDRDLGAAADDVAVAGRDRRLREGDDRVVEVGEELHAANLALRVQLLPHVGAGGEAKVVGGADHQHPHGVIAARHRQVLEQLDQHLGVDRVARFLALQAQQDDAVLVDQVAGQIARLAHAPEPSCSSKRSVSSAAPATSASTSAFGSRKRPST